MSMKITPRPFLEYIGASLLYVFDATEQEKVTTKLKQIEQSTNNESAAAAYRDIMDDTNDGVKYSNYVCFIVGPYQFSLYSASGQWRIGGNECTRSELGGIALNHLINHLTT